MQRRGAVIFDMDGVIVDSEPRHERAFLEARVVALFRREQPLFEGLVALVERLACEYSLAVASGSQRAVI
jgi:beta-phosphoglucomutase-like phosphatase (HAD superfamily)